MSAKKTSPSRDKIRVLEEKLKRSMADYSNLEKRIDGQRQFYAALSAAGIISKMLEVLDDLYLSQAHLKNPGLAITIDKFVKILSQEGLSEIKAEGELFDPVSMDCVDVAEGKQDYVVTVRKNGYKLNNQILRPAQVVVGRQNPKK